VPSVGCRATVTAHTVAAVPGPAVPGPAVPGPAVPGPAVPGPGFTGPPRVRVRVELSLTNGSARPASGRDKGVRRWAGEERR
jgi:hypothetical protein